MRDRPGLTGLAVASRASLSRTGAGVVIGPCMTARTVDLYWMPEGPCHTASRVTTLAFQIIACLSVLLGSVVTRGTSTLRRMTEEPVGTGRMTLRAVVRCGFMSRFVAARTRRRFHVVARGAQRGHVSFEVVRPLTHSRDNIVRPCGRILGVEDASLAQRFLTDVMADCGVTFRACPVAGVLGVGTPAYLDIDTLVTRRAPLVGHDCGLGQGEGGIVGDVLPELAQSNVFMGDAFNQAGVHMALDTGHIGVRAFGPGRVVRLHLVTGDAESGLVRSSCSADESSQ